MIEQYGGKIGCIHPLFAPQSAESIENQNLRSSAISLAIGQWVRRDPVTAAYAENLPQGRARDLSFQQYAINLFRSTATNASGPRETCGNGLLGRHLCP